MGEVPSTVKAEKVLLPIVSELSSWPYCETMASAVGVSMRSVATKGAVPACRLHTAPLSGPSWTPLIEALT